MLKIRKCNDEKHIFSMKYKNKADGSSVHRSSSLLSVDRTLSTKKKDIKHKHPAATPKTNDDDERRRTVEEGGSSLVEVSPQGKFINSNIDAMFMLNAD